ncbi:hypothetical protein LBMAG42_32880 [Deltaproteobacteria bacterium]|nr:hypothetical protein LBMAG42_32880 [Deltaproteobacteria bacterium]
MVLAGIKPVIALVGRCGLERLAEVLRARGEAVAVLPGADVPALRILDPELVYADPFDAHWATPLGTGALAGRATEPAAALAGPAAILDVLGTFSLVVRGVRLPPVGAFGLEGAPPPALAAVFAAAQALTRAHRTIDVAGLWARHGILDDAVRFGPGHGEAEVGPLGESRLGAGNAADVEADAVLAWLAARRGRAFKALVVDLDNTLVYGEIADPEFSSRNPAWCERGTTPVGDAEAAWWRAPRGLHEAIRVCRGRGLALALCTRNERAFVGRHLRIRDDRGPWGDVLRDGLLDIANFDVVEAGFGPKSAACLRVAERLGVHPESVVFLDDSEVEREEVRVNGGGVRVLGGPVEAFRETLLTGAGFFPWTRTAVVALRPDSWRSRAAVVDAAEAGEAALEAFLLDLEIVVELRLAAEGDEERVVELLARTHQLRLTGVGVVAPGARVYVASCRDRLAEHGLVAVAWFVGEGRERRLVELAVSCRVLPHRIAASVLAACLAREPRAAVSRVDTGRNGASVGVIEEARGGVARWVRVAWEIRAGDGA